MGAAAAAAATMRDGNTTGSLTYGCTVTGRDLQAQYKSQVEQPRRHLPMRWHRLFRKKRSRGRGAAAGGGGGGKLAGFYKPDHPIGHLIRTPPIVRVR